MKELTHQEYHHALALFIIAHRKQMEVVKLENEMNEILSDESGSHASDAIYNSDSIQDEKKAFDDALELMNIFKLDK